MKKVMKNAIAIIGLTFLGMGITNATPSSDCGDDDVQPINVHSTAKTAIKES